MSPGTYCDCVHSKYSFLLSVLYFKLFRAAALISIFYTNIKREGSV